MITPRIFLFFILLFVADDSFSQINQPHSSDINTSPLLTNLRKKYIATSINPLHLDSSSIIPNTFSAPGISPDVYTVDYVNAVLRWKHKPQQDSLLITYRVFPVRLNSVTRHFNYDSIRFNFERERPFVYRNAINPNDNKIIDFGNFTYNGSIGRGISLGNSQNAVVNSSLNLQLNGYIGDSLELTAAISDNNIPIQPQGNTQNLSDFDRIYMQIKKHGWQANFGDIDIRQSQNYFLKFGARLQGASFINDTKIGTNMTNSLLVSGAIAKGKFNRNEITPIEGNQGPYRLSGANGELYFTVLAGTEKVFIDGQVMVRGQDQDYTIDYNTAEVSFTAKRLITKDSRIQVEFEYSDRNYLNSLLYASDEFAVTKKLKVSIGAYSNTDAKNTSINQTLDANQKEFLSQIGNKTDSAFYPDAALDTFGIGKILYKRIDSVYNGVHDSVYVYSVSMTDTLYNLAFTEVGQGKGNYIQANTNANGQVFMWVAPVNGVPQGSWAPVILLVAPTRQQVVTMAGQYFINDKSYVKTELAVSHFDPNTFSLLGKNQDNGFAGKFEVNSKNAVLRNLQDGLTLQSGITYEHVGIQFKPIERLRDVEFNRDWSLPFNAPAATEDLATGSLQLTDKKNNLVHYELSTYDRSDNFGGIRNAVEHQMSVKGWKLSDKFYLTNINSAIQKGNYLRPAIDISRKFPALRDYTFGASFTAENNQQHDKQADTLLAESFAFSIWQVYLKSSEKKLDRWGLTYFTRINKIPYPKGLVTGDKSQNISLTNELLKNKNRQFRMNLTYRKLEVINQGTVSEKSDQSLLGRIEYNFHEWKGLVAGNALYEIGTGQEQKTQYTYIQVPAPTGYYTWIDYNGDGIPELNEFEVAVYPDQKTWIRVLTPTNDYVKANYLQFNYSISINPSAILKATSGNPFLRFVNRFSTTSSLQINKKDLAGNNTFEFNPLTKHLVDTTLISLTSFLTNTLYFNRKSAKWGIDITDKLNTNKSLLNYGFESNKISELNGKIRWNLNRSINTSFTSKLGVNELINNSFANRNYHINEVSSEPSVSYIYKSNLRVSLIYTYDVKNNQTGFMEQTISNALAAEVRYNVLSAGTLNGRLSFNNISFNPGTGGSADSPEGYVLLNGLVPGANYIWDLELTKRLAGNIEINFQYEGRKPGSAPTVNTGSASVKAIF